MAATPMMTPIKVRLPQSVYSYLVRRSLREGQSLCGTAAEILTGAVRHLMEIEEEAARRNTTRKAG